MDLIKNYVRRILNNYKINNTFNSYKVLQEVDLEKKIENHSPSQVKTIAFIIPGIKAFSGGHTSILRLGTYMVSFGYHVSYITYDQSTADYMRENARKNLNYFKGEIIARNDIGSIYDIGIGTDFLSCYHLNVWQKKFKYKMYFVQDFEPAFFPEGDMYFLALNTYKMGLHIISLGEWNQKRIKEKCETAKIDTISFPFEPKQYNMCHKPIMFKKKIVFAIFFKLEEKRAPILILQSLKLLEKTLYNNGYETEFLFFGMDNKIKMPFGKNIGKLNHEELMNLYRNVDFGVVASYTNVSLVPYEMTTQGLPVIEFKDGSAIQFFGDDSLIMVESYPKDFVDKVMYWIEHHEVLTIRVEEAQKIIQMKTWENTSLEFKHIIEHLVTIR